MIAALAPAKDLKVSDVKRQLDLLRELAQGGLGLGSGGKAARGQQVGVRTQLLAGAPVSCVSQPHAPLCELLLNPLRVLSLHSHSHTHKTTHGGSCWSRWGRWLSRRAES